MLTSQNNSLYILNSNFIQNGASILGGAVCIGFDCKLTNPQNITLPI